MGGRVTQMWVKRNLQTNLLRKFKGNKPLGRPKHI
jgi:hypothetical protein